jgi:hypothetical protein
MPGEVSLVEQLRLRQRAAASGQATAEAAPVGSPPAGAGTPPPPPPDPSATEGEDADVENELAYGHYRGVQDRAINIEFQLLDEKSWPAPGYAWLPCPVWLPSGDGKGRGQVIVLEYLTGLKVTVRGINLRQMYERILRQKVFRISEMGEEAMAFVPEGSAVTFTIGVEEAEDEEARPQAGRRRQSG